MLPQMRLRWVIPTITGFCLFFLYRQYEYLGIFGKGNSPVSKVDRHEREVTLDDGVILFTRTSNVSNPNLLWMTLTHDSESWGRHNFHQRDVQDFLRLIPPQIPPSKISLALLTSSKSEYQSYVEATAAYDFAKVTIIYHSGFHDGQAIDRKHRQDPTIQTARRAELAKLRNYLMLRTLESEKHILWTDADVYQYDKGIVRRMLDHIEVRPDVGLITARCTQGGNDNYDHNAWRGTRQGPRGWDLTPQEIANGELSKQGQHHVPAVITGSSNDDLLELDNVGATILYIRASLVWQGLNFPHQYVVGTRWGKDGWDGIESEGLCYRARNLTGGKCMVMGGSWHVEHTKG